MQSLVNRYQVQDFQLNFFKSPLYTHQKIPDLNRKAHVDTKLGCSFYYLPYTGICKSQKCRWIYTVTLLMNFVSVGIIISQ